MNDTPTRSGALVELARGLGRIEGMVVMMLVRS